MCDLLNLQKDSVVLDTCSGSGGFGAVAYGNIERLLRDSGTFDHSSLNHIKEKQIIGVELDEAASEKACGVEGIISTPESKVKLCVIPTNEELAIARDTLALI